MGSSKLKIGNVSLDGNIVLAPMAGVTDLPFRLLCKEQGADLICTEMVSAKGIFYNNKNTGDLLGLMTGNVRYRCSYLAQTRILSVRWQRKLSIGILTF